MKVLSCKDVGVQCDWVGRAGTVEELMKKAAEHGAKEHGMKDVPKEILEKIKAAIREE